MLHNFVRDVVPQVAGVVACSHSAGYALDLAATEDLAELRALRAIALVAATWRGPLPIENS